MRALNIADFSDLLAKPLEAERDEEEDRLVSIKGKSKPGNNTNNEEEKKNNQDGLPKCWHCLGYHYNRNFPVLQKN